ncbi:MAG: PPC domain-containing protein, partial [Egibacteraceae bacterium]
LDLYVFGPDGSFVGGSGSATSAEQVDVDAPAAGTYSVYVHGWQTDGPDANYTLFSWQVGSAAAGNMTVDAPDTANLAQSADVTVTWSDLTQGRWMGAVTYHDDAAAVDYRDDLVDVTLVRVDVGEGNDAP